MEECLSLTGAHKIFAVLLIQHVVILIVLLVWIRTSRKTVELAHPMYALLHQEMIVLALFSSMDIVVLLALPFLEERRGTILGGFYMVINIAALQFHQVTCLSVACLR